MLSAGFCFGQNTLIVVPLQNPNHVVEDGEVETLGTILENALQRTNRFVVVDRSALEDLMQEHQFQMSDWSSDAKSAEMGKILNADFIFRGAVSKLGPNLFVTGRILDVKNAVILDSNEMRLSSIDEAYDKMEKFISGLTDQVKTGLVQQVEQTREAERAEKQAKRIEWGHKRWYLGGGIGGNSGSTIRNDDQDDYSSRNAIVALFKAEHDIAKHFAIDFDLGLGLGGDEISSHVRIMAHAPFRFDSGFDIGILGGLHLDPEIPGLAAGVSTGLRTNTTGEIFVEMLLMKPFQYRGTITTIIIGYKTGIGARK
jgi:TolB-like protein